MESFYLPDVDSILHWKCRSNEDEKPILTLAINFIAFVKFTKMLFLAY
jgi:hypothetical protein